MVAPGAGLVWPGMSVLTYHRVGIFDAPAVHRGIHCRVEDFRAHLRWLRRVGFRVISFAEAHAALFAGGPPSPRAVVLTFDDGYQDFCEHALPILREQGRPATLFAVAGRLGQAADWDAQDGYLPPPLMSAATLREVAACGLEIGSHGFTHRRLTQLTDAELCREVGDSKAALEDVIGARVRYFSYPYGDHDVRVRDAVQAAGYEAAVTTARAVASRANTRFEIPRKSVGFRKGPVQLLWKLWKR